MSSLTFPCPRCGKTIYPGNNPHYYTCNKAEGGCGELFAKVPNCFFHNLYMLNSQGEIIGYIEGDAVGCKEKWRKIIKTDRFLPDKNGWFTL